MATLINLNDLLRHEILDLYSAEEQIIEALPKMIEKANNGNLKKALSDHLKVTEQQKKRLDQVKELLGADPETGNTEENKGFFSRMFGGSGSQKCRGTEGLIEEGEKMMGEEMSPEALDAAIIASAQKIEHYEISGYGTARAFARELNLMDVSNLLTQTLNEEYQADDSLTQLAVGRLNIEAEYASGVDDNKSGNGRSTTQRTTSDNGSTSAKRAHSNGRSSNGAQKSTSSKQKTKGGNKNKTGGRIQLTRSSKKSASKNAVSKGSAKKTTVKGRSSAGKSAKKSAVSRRSSGTRPVSVKSGSPSKSISKIRGRNKSASKGTSSRKSSASKRARSVGRR